MPTRIPQDLPAEGKVLAFDVGTKTLGLAISDGLRITAQPRPTLPYAKWGQLRPQLEDLVKAENVTCCIVGLPLHMSGAAGSSADRAMSFADQLEKDLGLPVLLWDERLSTKAAEAAMFEQRTGRQTRAGKKSVKQQNLDSVAASLILQSALALIGAPR